MLRVKEYVCKGSVNKLGFFGINVKNVSGVNMRFFVRLDEA